MRLSLSNLSFTGFEYSALGKLPDHLGLELFYEFGGDLLWERVLEETYSRRPAGRRGSLSLHGPCVATNLADAEDCRYRTLYNRAFDFAAKWQADFVVAHTNESFTGNPAVAKELVKHRLGELLSLARMQDVKVLIENVGLRLKGSLLFDCEEYLELLAGLPRAGALLDTGHAFLNGWDIPAVVRRLGPRLCAVHLHDNRGTGDEHLPIGCGNIQWEPVFRSIREFAPEAVLVFEYAGIKIDEALDNIKATCSLYLE